MIKINLYIKRIITCVLSVGMISSAYADSQYYLYQKGDTTICDISTKEPRKYKRGSRYHLIGHDASRLEVKKIGRDKGCESF